MTWLKKWLFYVPTVICFVYAAVVGLDAVYVGLIASPEVFAERYAELFDASFTTIAGAGHLVPLDEPAAAAALVNSFYLTLEK